MSENDKICTIGYLIDTFSQYSPSTMEMIYEQGLFVEPSQTQLCPTYYQVANSSRLSVSYTDGKGTYISVYFNGKPKNFPLLTCNPEHIPAQSLSGETLKYYNNSLVCEVDVSYKFIERNITIISSGIPLTDHTQSVLYFVNSVQVRQDSAVYDSRTNNSIVAFTLLSGLAVTLRFNPSNVSGLDDFDLSTFVYTITRGNTTSDEYHLYNSGNWNNVTVDSIESDITINVSASLGQITNIQFNTDNKLVVSDYATGQVIVPITSNRGTYQTTYQNNMQFMFSIDIPDYSLYTKLNYKINKVNGYVSDLIMDGSMDITGNVYYISSGYSSGNTIGMNVTEVGSYQITLSTVKKTNILDVTFCVIPFPEEYSTKADQIQFYHGKDDDAVLVESGVWNSDNSMQYPVQLTEEESRGKKVNFKLYIRGGTSGNYAKDFIISKLRVGTTSGSGREYDVTSTSGLWTTFVVTDCPIPTLSVTINKIYLNILNSNAARLAKLYIGQDDVYENYVDKYGKTSAMNKTVASVYNIDKSNEEIIPSNTGVVTVDAIQTNKNRLRFKVVASTYDTTKDITDYEPKIFMKTISGNLTLPYTFTDINVQTAGSFNSGDELTITADNLATYPQTYQLGITRQSKYMPKYLIVKINQVNYNGTWVPKLLEVDGKYKCYTHMNESDFTGLNSTNVSTWDNSGTSTDVNHIITYFFENITSGRFVSFILDFTGADMNAIYQYVMHKKYVYGNNATAVLDEQTDYKKTVSKSSFRHDSSSTSYILATNVFGSNNIESTTTDLIYIYYKRTIRQSISFDITITNQPTYSIDVEVEEHEDTPHIHRIVKLYYRKKHTDAYTLLSETGVNRHMLNMDYIDDAYIDFRMEIDTSIPNLDLYKARYAVAVGTTRVATGVFTSTTTVTVQNAVIDGTLQNVFEYGYNHGIPVSFSVISEKTAKQTPVVLVIYKTYNELVSDGISDFKISDRSNATLFKPDGTEITSDHSFTNPDGQTCIFKVLNIGSTPELYAQQQSLWDDWEFILNKGIKTTDVSSKYANMEMSIWFSTASASSSTTSNYLGDDDNWYKSVWLNNYQNGELFNSMYIYDTSGCARANLQGTTVAPTADNPYPDVFTKTSGTTSEGLDFDNVNIWRINLRFTPKPPDQQKLEAFVHQMFIRRSFDTSYRIEYETTNPLSDGAIETSNMSVFMVEIEARNTDGSAVTTDVMVKINGGGDGTAGQATVDDYYVYSAGEDIKFTSYRKFYRNYYRESETTRNDWWYFKALPRNSSQVSAAQEYIENPNTTHIACIECKLLDYDVQNHMSAAYPIVSGASGYPWEIFGNNVPTSGDYEYPYTINDATKCMMQLNGLTPVRILGAGSLIPNMLVVGCNVVTPSANVYKTVLVSPEIHSVRYMEFLPECELIIQARPKVPNYHKSYSYFSSNYVQSSFSTLTWVGFFRHDNLKNGDNFGPANENEFGPSKGNRFIYGDLNVTDPEKKATVRIFVDGGETVSVTDKFITTVTRFASSSSSTGGQEANEYGNRYSKVVVKFNDNTVDYMQPANSTSTNYFVYQLNPNGDQNGDQQDVVSYRIVLDLDGVFAQVTIPARHKIRFWIKPLNNQSIKPYDFALVESDAILSYDVYTLNNFKGSEYKEKYFICPVDYKRQYNDGTYPERTKTLKTINELNKNYSSPLVGTLGPSGPGTYTGSVYDVAVSYNSATYYPSFDVSHLPYFNIEYDEWRNGVNQNTSVDNWTGYYRVYRRNRENPQNQWAYYSSVLFRPNYFNYIFVEKLGSVNPETSLRDTEADSYVPYYENVNFLYDTNGQFIHYDDVPVDWRD